MPGLKIAPSLLAADFSRLGEEIAAIEDAADWLHLDVMDGHFVPNLSFGIPVIRSIRASTDLFFDCHVMATNPDAFLRELSGAGVQQVTMHIEAVPNPAPAMKRAREEGLAFGLVLNPSTPPGALDPYIEKCQVVVVMSVEPGHGGQAFQERVLPKVETLREWVEKRGLATDIQLDGGVDPGNAARATSAGANVLVAGTSVFGADDPRAAVMELRRSMESA